MWEPNYACDSQTKPRWTVSGTMFLECLDSDADASVVIIIRQWLNQQQHYTPETLANIHRSLGMIHCVSACWNPMCQCLAFTVTPAYKAQSWVSNVLDTNRLLFFSLPCFRFHTSASVLQHFPLSRDEGWGWESIASKLCYKSWSHANIESIGITTWV